MNTDDVATLIQTRYAVGDTFTANDLPLTGDGHSQGAIFQHLKRRGVIRKTGHYKQSTNPRSRGDVLAIWRRAA